MEIKHTKHNLKKLETVFESLGYVVRYEKGNFQSGYCMVKDKKIAVINKFFDTKGRIDCLIDILKGPEFENEELEDSKLNKFFLQIRKDKIIKSESSSEQQ
ncbi:MAG: hypothetical protein AAFO07_00580 [Bacteroidota bacterium]